MRKSQINTQTQAAQGIVEFALVLPVLMLVILGIFAFGHYFFSYSSIVSASREAARWGAAVGIDDNGYPRYQDCKAMREAAVRVGSFAGVTADRVSIAYDHGPNPDGSSTPYETCTGDVGSGGVILGDRILVSITVPYQPIVPFVQMPNVNITATTNRTVLRDLPAGDVPTAVSLTPVVNLAIVSIDHEPSSVGQMITVTVKAIGSDGVNPEGTISIRDSANPTNNILCSNVTLTATATSGTTQAVCTYTYTLAGDYFLLAHYTHSISQNHFSDTDTALFPHQVIPGQTKTAVTDSLNPSMVGNQITITAHVADTLSGNPITVGTAKISPDPANLGSKAVNTSGNVSFTFIPNWQGMQPITVTYEGATNQYLTSSGFVDHVVNTPSKKDVSMSVSVTPASGTAQLGQAVDFVITVTDPSNSGVPTGWVSLVDSLGRGCSGQMQLTPSGSYSATARCTTSFSSSGTYGLALTYGGDTNYNGSSSTYPYGVGEGSGRLSPTIAVTADPATSSPGDEVRFTIIVSGTGGTPTGTVTLSDGTRTCLGGSSQPLSGGQAYCRMVFPAAGAYALTASYSGDSVYGNGSTGLTYNVGPSPSWCPTASGLTFSSSTGGLYFTVTNSSTSALNIQWIKALWPDGGVTTNLQEVRFDGSNKYTNSCLSGGNGNQGACVWKNNSGLSRVGDDYATLNSNVLIWDPSNSGLAASSSKYMWYQFSHSLSTGHYSFLVNFLNGSGTCTMVVEADKTTQ